MAQRSFNDVTSLTQSLRNHSDAESTSRNHCVGYVVDNGSISIGLMLLYFLILKLRLQTFTAHPGTIAWGMLLLDYKEWIMYRSIVYLIFKVSSLTVIGLSN